jgi:ATP-dependent Zn protease
LLQHNAKGPPPRTLAERDGLPSFALHATIGRMEATAYHEAGHVFMAIYVGARVRSVTIEPERDDGPDRFGDTHVEWDHRRFTTRELHEKSVLAYLEKMTAQLYRTLNRDEHWAALAAITDELLAHETIDGEQAEEIMQQWLP